LKNPADFKGTKEGIRIQIDESVDFDAALAFLRKKLDQSLAFYKEAEIIGTEGKILLENERAQLYQMLIGDYQINVKTLDNISNMQVKIERIIEKAEPESGKGASVFIRRTLRSGVSIKSEGDLVVVGDVNPGAELIAVGNIVIMGALRGVAHAGCLGDRTAVVAANKLLPTQLRIDTLITISPEEDDEIQYPEIAEIKDGQIVIEPYI